MKTPTVLLASVLLLAAPAAFAAPCAFTLQSNDAMKFDATTIPVSKACKSFTITLKHTGKFARATMGHNLVITKASDATAVNADGMKAGLASEYVKPNDPRVVASSKVIGGGESTTITLSPAKLAKGDFAFFCSFPGHAGIMKGQVKLVP